jgi:hypothetical protein
MRATAAECLQPFTCQAIRKHLCDCGVGAGVAPDFMTKRNSGRRHRRRDADDAERPEIGDEQVPRHARAETRIHDRAGMGG